MAILLGACSAALAAVLGVSPERGSVSFELPASLDTVRGRAPAFAGSLDTERLTATVTFEAASLTTGLGPRDSRMRWHCLEAPLFPTITLVVTRIEGAVAGLHAGAGTGDVTLVGTLAIRDVVRPVRVAATYAWEGGAVRLKGRHALAWAEWNIPDPSTLLSTVNPEMTVTFYLLASPS